MKKIFISYNWGSREVVEKIVDLLKSKDGYQVWMDNCELTPGEQFRSEISRGIDDCTIFVAFITEKYCDSKNCQSETHYAFDKNKKCIYVMLEENFGDDPSGIRIIVAPCLRINAYEHMNQKDRHEIIHQSLSEAIKGKLKELRSQRTNGYFFVFVLFAFLTYLLGAAVNYFFKMQEDGDTALIKD